MKKFFLFVFFAINLSLQAQDSLVQKIQTHYLQQMPYCEYTSETDLGDLQKVYEFPYWFVQINKELNALKQYDSKFADYLQIDSIQGSKVYQIGTQQGILNGVEVDLHQNSNPIYNLYQNGELINSYVFDMQRTLLEKSKEFVKQGFSVDNKQEIQLDNLQPLLIDRVNKDTALSLPWAYPDSCLQVLSYEKPLEKNNFTETLILTKQDSDTSIWYVLGKKNSLIHLYSFVTPKDKLKIVDFKKTTISNIGFDQKRIIIEPLNKPIQIWGVYFEPTRNSPWEQPNQFIFDFLRKSDKKNISARVVVDKDTSLESPEFNLLLSLSQNPELFKLTTGLIDIDFQQLCNNQILPMTSDFKETYIKKP
ncbi:hypothetical protein [Myroides sp. LJL119]